MHVITIYIKMNLFSKYFQNMLMWLLSELRPLVQSSWRNRIGLLRWRRGLGTTGTANWACNVINNTVNTTVQQCIHNSMIIICLAILNNLYQSNSIHFNAYSSSLKEAFNLCSSPLKRAFNSCSSPLKRAFNSCIHFIKCLFVVL